jgi:hypothetical protein
MQWDTVQQFVRMGIQAGAGALVARGFIDNSVSEALIGGLMSLSSVAWWLVWNRKRKA